MAVADSFSLSYVHIKIYTIFTLLRNFNKSHLK